MKGSLIASCIIIDSSSCNAFYSNYKQRSILKDSIGNKICDAFLCSSKKIKIIGEIIILETREKDAADIIHRASPYDATFNFENKRTIDKPRKIYATEILINL